MEEKIQQSYRVIYADRDFLPIVQEMKATARANRINPDDANELIKDEPGEKKQIGPMIRIHGLKLGEFAGQFSKFISFVQPTPLQISYMEYFLPDESYFVGQLSIINNNREPLKLGDVSRITSFFFDPDNTFEMESVGELPPYISLQFQKFSE